METAAATRQKKVHTVQLSGHGAEMFQRLNTADVIFIRVYHHHHLISREKSVETRRLCSEV